MAGYPSTATRTRPGQPSAPGLAMPKQQGGRELMQEFNKAVNEGDGFHPGNFSQKRRRLGASEGIFGSSDARETGESMYNTLTNRDSGTPFDRSYKNLVMAARGQ